MLEKRGNILDQLVLDTYDAICFTSNGIVKSNGELVMGAGIAKSFKDRWPDLPKRFGSAVRLDGNVVNYFDQQIRYDREIFVVAFPTKHNWRDNSDIELIKKSSNQLVSLANRMMWKNVGLTRPGCGHGGLSWEKVRTVIGPILDDRFSIFYL